MLCYADGEAVTVLQRKWFRWRCVGSRQLRSRAVAFLGNTGLLAVARSDERWLEIWRPAYEMPIVVAISLPQDPTCIAADENLVAVGFQNGDIMSAHLRIEKA
jgi:hypothetical protein